MGNISPVFELDPMLHTYFSLKTNKKIQQTPSIALSQDESIVLKCIQKTRSCSLEAILGQIHTNASQLLTTISMLEMKQLIGQKSPGIYYVF